MSSMMRRIRNRAGNLGFRSGDPDFFVDSGLYAHNLASHQFLSDSEIPSTFSKIFESGVSSVINTIFTYLRLAGSDFAKL